jgi:acetyltransferase-like isoleucine patch superfamily enzyme
VPVPGAVRLRLALRALKGDTPKSPAQKFRALMDEGIVEVGAHSYGHPQVEVWRGADGQNLGGRLRIGKYCSIAHDVVVLTGGEHHPEWVSTFPFRDKWDLPGKHSDGQPTSKGDVVIGNDVWVGEQAMILSGVTVGDGAVIAARSLVIRDVEPYAIVGGNPAALIRHRFPPEQVAALLGSQWWDWPEDRVRRLVPKLSSGDVDAFLAGA